MAATSTSSYVLVNEVIYVAPWPWWLDGRHTKKHRTRFHVSSSVSNVQRSSPAWASGHVSLSRRTSDVGSIPPPRAATEITSGVTEVLAYGTAVVGEPEGGAYRSAAG
jgi:hypothetical protein